MDTVRPWKAVDLKGCSARPLLHKVIENGKRIAPTKPLCEIRDYVRRQLESEIWQEEQRFENPHLHHLDMSPAYYQMKMDLLQMSQRRSD